MKLKVCKSNTGMIHIPINRKSTLCKSNINNTPVRLTKKTIVEIENNEWCVKCFPKGNSKFIFTFGLLNSTLTVKPILRKQTIPFIMGIHYAKRIPSISYSFGLFIDDDLEGICTFGSPASPWLCKGVCGESNRGKVIELNRLVLKNNVKNHASFLVANSIKLLPKPKVIVSYADTAQNHIGTVYQATNWLFTGTTKARTDIAATNGKHSRHHAGDKTNRVYRSAKHRYIYFTGSKSEKRTLFKSLNYDIQQYPKSNI